MGRAHVMVVDRKPHDAEDRTAVCRLWSDRPREALQAMSFCAAWEARHWRAKSKVRADVCGLEDNASALREPQQQPLRVLRRQGDQGLQALERLREVLCRHGATTDAEAFGRAQGRERQLHARQLHVGDRGRAAQQRAQQRCSHLPRADHDRDAVGQDAWRQGDNDLGESSQRLVHGAGAHTAQPIQGAAFAGAS